MRLKLDIQRFAEDGEIIIGTKVDNSGLKKDLNKTNQILNSFDKEGLNFKDIDITNPEDVDALREAMDLLKEIKKEEINLIPNIDIRNLEMQKLEIMDELTEIITEMDKALQINPEMNFKDLSEYLKRLNLISNKLDEIDLKEEEIGKGGFAAVNVHIDDAGKKITNLISKVGRWGLSLLGVQSILSLITSSMSVLSNYNTELANKLKSIRLALATALQPLVEKLVHWIEILLSYLNVLTKLFFGIDIFAQGAELSTSKIADNMGEAAGKAKEMRKQLAGFDEMNVLNDNVSTSRGSGGSGGIGNTDDFKFNLEEQPVAEWFKKVAKWIKENYKWLLLIAGVIGAIGLAVKGLNLVSTISSAAGALGGLSTPLLVLAGAVGRVSAEILSLGLYLDSLQVATDNTDASVGGLARSLTELFGSSTLMSFVNPFLAVIMKLSGQTYILNQYMNNSKAIITNLDTAERKLKEAEDERLKAIKNLKDIQSEYNTQLDAYESASSRATDTQKALAEAERETGLSGEELFNQVKNGTKSYLDMDDAQKKVYKAYVNNIDAQQQLQKETETLTNKEKDLKKATDEQAESDKLVEKRKRELGYATQLASGDFDGFKKSIVDAMENGEISTKDAQKYISQAMAKMSDDGKQTFIKDLPDSIKTGLDPSKYETKGQKLQRWFSSLSSTIGGLFSKLGGGIGEAIWGGIKGVLNYAIAQIEWVLNGVVWLINQAIPLINKLPGVSLGKLSSFNLPRLATGAIINQPGKGVPVGNAIAGESGREGILPLTDHKAMEMLGKEIGKWITLNATIPVSVGNRQIVREVRQLMAQDDFAMNN